MPLQLPNLPPEVFADQQLTMRVEAREAAGDAIVRRVKDLSLFFASMLGIAVLVGVCATVAMTCRSTDETRWAMSLVAAVVSGLLGYLMRR